MSLSNYTASELLKKFTGETVAMTLTTNLFVAIGTGVNEDGLTAELAVSGYTRTSTNPADWSIVNSTLSNAITILIPSYTENFGTPTHWAVYDALTNGNCLFYGNLDDPKFIADDQQAYFGPGLLYLQFPALISNTGITRAFAQTMLGFIAGKLDYASPSIYVGYCNTQLTATSDISGEPIGNGYTRELITFKAVSGTSPAITTNTAQITYVVTGVWGVDIKCIFLSKSASSTLAADLLFVGALPFTSPGDGDTFILLEDAISISFT